MVHVIHELHVLNESMDVSFVSLYIIRSQYFHNVLWILSAYHWHCINVFSPDEKLQLGPETEWELIHVYTFHKAKLKSVSTIHPLLSLSFFFSAMQGNLHGGDIPESFQFSDINCEIKTRKSKASLSTHMINCLGVKAIWWPGSFWFSTNASGWKITLTFLFSTTGWSPGSTGPCRSMGICSALTATWVWWSHQTAVHTLQVQPIKPILALKIIA